jgi:hypothetical protein
VHAAETKENGSTTKKKVDPTREKAKQSLEILRGSRGISSSAICERV